VNYNTENIIQYNYNTES